MRGLTTHSFASWLPFWCRLQEFLKGRGEEPADLGGPAATLRTLRGAHCLPLLPLLCCETPTKGSVEDRRIPHALCGAWVPVTAVEGVIAIPTAIAISSYSEANQTFLSSLSLSLSLELLQPNENLEVFRGSHQPKCELKSYQQNKIPTTAHKPPDSQLLTTTQP